jgi:hypothetical protein
MAGCGTQWGKALVGIVLARDEFALAVRDISHRSESIMLQLKNPVAVIERLDPARQLHLLEVW